jgi:hypothetical protein
VTVPAPHEWQTAAAEAYSRLGGVVVDREPGSGKTYAAALIARRCARPMVVAPASVIPQTMKMFRSYGVPCMLAKDWLSDRTDFALPAFASYTWLTRKRQADFFERYRPSDVLMDEYHEARGLNNSARKRLERDLIARPEVRVGVFSASLVTDRVTDYGPAITWALRGRARDLVPPTRAGLEALQERFEADPRAYAAFLARLDAHPGVFRDGDGVGRYQGEVVVRVLRREPALVLRDDWELPDGYLLVSPAQAAEVSRLMAWGAWLRVTPRPSEAYLEARRAWHHTVRGVIATGAADTAEQVYALRPREYAAWVEAEDAEPRGVEEVVWEDTLSLEAEAFDLNAPHQPATPTIVWADRRALQDKMAERLDCPLHRERGRDSGGTRIDEATAPLVVASIEACGQSFNCQAFSHNLVLEPPSDPEVWRQLIGRTARQGQRAARVTVDVVVNCPAAESALRTAIARARVSGKPNPILQLDGF